MNTNNEYCIAGYGIPAVFGIEVLLSMRIQADQIYIVTHQCDPRNEILWNFARYHNIDIFDYETNSPQLVDLITIRKTSIIISLHYRNRIPQNLLNIPEYGGINLHPSLLPDYRGCFSIPWAIINGEKETGFTFHYMTEKFDQGNIILQKKFPIHNEDTAFSVFHKSILYAVHELNNVLVRVIEKKENGTPQVGIGSYYARGLPFKGYIDSNWDVDMVDRYIRAMYFPPYKSGILKFKDMEYEIDSISKFHKILSSANE